jgi:translation initiation factor IF-3
MANEQLVATIMRMKGAATAAAVQVRVVPDPLQPPQQQRQIDTSSADDVPIQPKKAVVVSLAEAIQSAIDAKQDLIEISLEQEVPVVTISRVQAFVYQSSKKAKTTAAAGHNKPLKEVTMRAGIADNDLQRKVLDVRKFLEKGHQCGLTVRAGRKHILNNADAVMTSIQRLLLLMQDFAEIVKAPSINPEKNMGQFRVRAKK